MGDEDEGDADLALDALELELHRLAQLEVERGQRLVEQQRTRPVDQCPRQRDALLLAAGQFPRTAVGLALELDQFEHLVDPRADLCLGDDLRRSPNATLSNTDMCGNSA